MTRLRCAAVCSCFVALMCLGTPSRGQDSTEEDKKPPPILAEHIRATYPRVSWRRTWQLIRETMDLGVKLQAFIQTEGHCPFVAG